MRYPIAIHNEKDSAYGVTVPDIEGCFSAGETFDEAIDQAEKAIHLHLSTLAEDGIFAPVASSFDKYQSESVFKGAVWGFVDIDIAEYSGKTKKINATLPTSILIRIQEKVDSGEYESRSSFLAEAALQKIQKYKKQ